MADTALPTNVKIDLEIELQGLAQLITKVRDAIVDCIRAVIDWDWLLESIRSFLSVFTIDKFKFGCSMQNSHISDFKIDLGMLISGNRENLNLKVAPFSDMLGLFKQWGNKAITDAIGFLDFPPFPNGCVHRHARLYLGSR